MNSNRDNEGEFGISDPGSRAERLRQGREERLRGVMAGLLKFLVLITVAAIIAFFVILRGNRPPQ